MRIVCDGLAVVTRVEGQLYAFGTACPPRRRRLGEGLLKGCVVKCPWHAGRWDVTTGQALTLLETTPIPIFDVRVEGDDIEIRLDDRAVAVAVAAELTPANTVRRGTFAVSSIPRAFMTAIVGVFRVGLPFSLNVDR